MPIETSWQGATLGANTFTGDQTLGTSNKLLWTGRGGIGSSSDGVLALYNNAGTGFTRLQFGGTTNGFPALQPSGSNLQVVAADNSVFRGLHAEVYQSLPGTALVAGGSTSMGFFMSNTSNFGVIGGSGAPTVSAAKGTLYLRSDGSTTNDRLYVNTNGTTGWAAITTAS